MKKQIKHSLEFYLMWHYLESVQNACFGALSMDNELERLFVSLYDYCAELVHRSYFGNIVEQYMVTVCEEYP